MKNLSKHIIMVTLLVVILGATSFVNRQNDEKREFAKKEIRLKTVLEVADSICQEAGVPFELVKQIGQNESGWRYIKNSNGGTDHGDLQVIDVTYWHYYNKLELTSGKTRRNYLKVAIYYLKDLHTKYGSWEKARFAYGRGKWRGPSTWTTLEKKFMSKIDFSQFDNKAKK
jgi:hypothetical protein